MRFSRARYVTLCQQSLVTAAVLAVGLSAAGVKTLDIVPQPGTAAGARGETPGSTPAQAFADDRSHDRAEVDTTPVTPKVREVAVTSKPSADAARTTKTQPKHAAPPKSESSAKTQQPATIEKIDPAKPGLVETAPQKVSGYATIGVTWKHGVNYADDQIKIQQRTLKSGTWSKWGKVAYHDDHGPDGLSSEEESARERPGTDALVIGDVDQVQMRAQTADGIAPPDLKLAIIDPGTGKMTKASPAIDTAKLPPSQGGEPQADGQTVQGDDGTQDTVSLSAMKRAPRPYIYSRAQWGANEKMREQSPPSYGTVKTGFVHHTVNANNYTSAQVPALLRGIYAYHTQSRGWRDIGYNFLVDRFGRIWEGRWGGVGRAVVGAHTLGYNEVSFAMSAIGNFDIAEPPTAVLRAYARLFAWKLSIYDIRANNPSVLVKGRTLKAINGHRDVGQTACPGRYLYAKLPWIRQRARTLQLDAQSGTGTSSPPPPAKPPVFTSPTQTPRAAVAQPKITFPKSTNLIGSSYPDLLVKKRSTGAISILPTGGQTGFRGTVTTPGGWRAMNLLAAVGDVTGDGKGDVMARSTRTGVTRIYRGNGTGHVGKKGFYPTTQFRPANLLVGAGDWNGDGKNDLLMRSKKSGSLYVLHGTGRGTFGSPHLLSKSWGSLLLDGGRRRPDRRRTPGHRRGEGRLHLRRADGRRRQARYAGQASRPRCRQRPPRGWRP